jgi:NhaP-type Na+/H+ or K+/H+ antiporter
VYDNLAILALFAFFFSLVGGRIDRSILTGPMVYLLFGLAVGPVGLNLLQMDVSAVEMRVIADLTLALVLFMDASNADLKVLRNYSALPTRMLLLGLPLCIALGTYIGTLVFPQVPVLEICILATILAPTDAALGKGVVSNPAVPSRIRQSLNAESGLNDGLCVPVLFVFIALATGQAASSDSGTLALRLVAEELGIGIAVAVVLVSVAARLMKLAARLGWYTDTWRQITVVALALACFATAQALHGSGFIACFVGGLLFGYFADTRAHALGENAEGIAELLSMLTWLVFGAVFLGQYLGDITWSVLLYSLLSLIVIRVLPVMLSLWGTQEDIETRLFLAWFGPRGLASIVFLVIVGGENYGSESILIDTVICTIVLCVVAHGLTANPWANRLARLAAKS